MEMLKQDAGLQAMNAAAEWLRDNDVKFKQMTAYHIKIGAVNFWPKTGTITVDGEDQRRSERGLDGLEVMLIEHRVIKRPKPISAIGLSQK